MPDWYLPSPAFCLWGKYGVQPSRNTEKCQSFSRPLGTVSNNKRKWMINTRYIQKFSIYIENMWLHTSYFPFILASLKYSCFRKPKRFSHRVFARSKDISNQPLPGLSFNWKWFYLFQIDLKITFEKYQCLISFLVQILVCMI